MSYREHGTNRVRVGPEEVERYPDNVVDAEEVAARLRVSPAEVRAWAASGCPHFRVGGGEPLFQIAHVKRWLIDSGLVVEYTGAPASASSEDRERPEPAAKDATPPALRGSDLVREIDTTARQASGIYFLCRGSKIVYVGQSVNVMGRVSSHKDKDFDSVFRFPVTRSNLSRVEEAFIRVLRPRYNRATTRKGSEADREADRKIVAKVCTYRSAVEEARLQDAGE